MSLNPLSSSGHDFPVYLYSLPFSCSKFLSISLHSTSPNTRAVGVPPDMGRSGFQPAWGFHSVSGLRALGGRQRVSSSCWRAQRLATFAMPLPHSRRLMSQILACENLLWEHLVLAWSPVARHCSQNISRPSGGKCYKCKTASARSCSVHQQMIGELLSCSNESLPLWSDDLWKITAEARSSPLLSSWCRWKRNCTVLYCTVL